MTAGSHVRILGQNFVSTAGQPERDNLVAVTFDGIEAEITKRSDSEIDVTAPDLGARDEPVDIVVRTSAGVETTPYRTLSYKRA